MAGAGAEEAALALNDGDQVFTTEAAGASLDVSALLGGRRMLAFNYNKPGALLSFALATPLLWVSVVSPLASARADACEGVMKDAHISVTRT